MEIDMSGRIITRHEGRVSAYKLLFAREFDKDTELEQFYDRYAYDIDGEKRVKTEYSSKFTWSLLEGVCSRIDEIDELIELTSRGWKMERMSLTTITALRLGVYELKYTETPAKVVINENIEIVKMFDDENAPAFVNGILNNIGRALGKIAEPQADVNPVQNNVAE